MEIVIYAKTIKKLTICSIRAVGYVNKVEESFEPDSNQRPKDIKYNLHSSALPTELSKKGLRLEVFKEKSLFHGKRMHLRGFTKFDNSFLLKRMEEDELQVI